MSKKPKILIPEVLDTNSLKRKYRNNLALFAKDFKLLRPSTVSVDYAKLEPRILAGTPATLKKAIENGVQAHDGLRVEGRGVLPRVSDLALIHARDFLSQKVSGGDAQSAESSRGSGDPRTLD